MRAARGEVKKKEDGCVSACGFAGGWKFCEEILRRK